MGTIRFSSSGSSLGAVGVLLGTQGLFHSIYGYDNSSSRIFLMKGSMPLQSEFDVTGISFRSSDRLVEFLVESGSGDTIADYANDRILSTYTEAQASASGTATWFMWDAIPTSDTEVAKIAGTVSVTGGGGDLQMSTVNIISGQIYACGPVALNFPTTWTY